MGFISGLFQGKGGFSLENLDLLKYGNILFQTVVVGLVAGAFYWFVVRQFFYKIDIFIIAKRGTKSLIIGKDKGRLRRDKDGITRLYLLKRSKEGLFGKAKGLTLKPPGYEYMLPNEKGGSAIFYHKISENEYHPVNILQDFGQIHFKPVQDDVMGWMVNEMKINYDKKIKQSTLMQYLPYLLFAVSVVGIIILWWMTMGKADAIANGLVAAGNKFGDAVRGLGTCVIPGAP